MITLCAVGVCCWCVLWVCARGACVGLPGAGGGCAGGQGAFQVPCTVRAELLLLMTHVAACCSPPARILEHAHATLENLLVFVCSSCILEL